MRNAGIVLFDDVEELDFVGPWEVLTFAAGTTGRDRVLTVATGRRPVRCAKGLVVTPDVTLDEAPPLDVVLVPGGQGTGREVEHAAMLAWLARVAVDATWVTSVCTGALLWHAAGPARGKRVTTHWSFVEALRARGDVTVLENVRYVRDGKLVTAGGVSAGVEMEVGLVGQRDGGEAARAVQRGIEYAPAPPYTAEV